MPPEMDSADGYDWSPGSFYDAHSSPGTENEWLLSDCEGSVPETASVGSYDMMSDLD